MFPLSESAKRFRLAKVKVTHCVQFPVCVTPHVGSDCILLLAIYYGSTKCIY